MGEDEFLGKSKVAPEGNSDEASSQVELPNFKLTIPHVGILLIGSPHTWETSRVSPGLCPKMRTIFKECSILFIISWSMPADAK